MQEARAASALNHPHIITIHEIESAEGRDFIVMEYVRGKSLDALIPRQGMRLTEALRIAIPVAEALAAAHARGIIHRDLKPANIVVGGRWRSEGPRLRPGQADGEPAYAEGKRGKRHARCGSGRQRTGRDCRDRRLYVARAGDRREDGCAERHLQLWDDALRDGDRGSAHLPGRPRPTL